jgi:hypothetical protein
MREELNHLTPWETVSKVFGKLCVELCGLCGYFNSLNHKGAQRILNGAQSNSESLFRIF